MRGDNAVRLRVMRVGRLGVFVRIHPLLRVARASKFFVLVEGNDADPGHGTISEMLNAEC